MDNKKQRVACKGEFSCELARERSNRTGIRAGSRSGMRRFISKEYARLVERVERRRGFELMKTSWRGPGETVPIGAVSSDARSLFGVL